MNLRVPCLFCLKEYDTRMKCHRHLWRCQVRRRLQEIVRDHGTLEEVQRRQEVLMNMNADEDERRLRSITTVAGDASGHQVDDADGVGWRGGGAP